MIIFAMVMNAVCYFVSNIYQNKFSESLADKKYPLPLFQEVWMGIAVIALLIIKLISGEFQLSVDTLVIAAISGIFAALSGMMLVLALGNGPMSLTILLFSINSVIPTILSLFLLNEKPTVFQIIGIILILGIFILINFNKNDLGMQIKKKWFSYISLAVLFTGINLFCIKLQQNRHPNRELIEYTVILYLSGMIITMICFVFLYRTEKDRKKINFNFQPSVFYLPAIIVALMQVGAMLCSLYNSSRIPSIILFPVTQLLTLMLTTIFSIVKLGERLNKKTIYCITASVIAIVIINL
ncbi:EamA family transporter [Anaerosacchariphilus polymeriproducens]|uniref:EamA domain-containing protein n=1 Tax=Anaerosacchariphilus polymeriproducens TaxID=1812858 RepID=A0A371AYL9_9FIRM|nr:EamA family transporter [Anaerosacchariphilus polymeriproducens]RDU24694.1 hypothetical protein DWV06_04290 [Anaerosacchariphilus polymeriproducens]